MFFEHRQHHVPLPGNLTSHFDHSRLSAIDFNWTMTYRTDSTVLAPHGRTVERAVVQGWPNRAQWATFRPFKKSGTVMKTELRVPRYIVDPHKNKSRKFSHY